MRNYNGRGLLAEMRLKHQTFNSVSRFYRRCGREAAPAEGTGEGGGMGERREEKRGGGRGREGKAVAVEFGQAWLPGLRNCTPRYYRQQRWTPVKPRIVLAWLQARGCNGERQAAAAGARLRRRTRGCGSGGEATAAAVTTPKARVPGVLYSIRLTLDMPWLHFL